MERVTHSVHICQLARDGADNDDTEQFNINPKLTQTWLQL
jgi:hypothetical protein